MALATRPKPPTHYKKRQAGHHRHSKDYLKTYWPYLPMLSIIGLGLVVSSLWASQSAVLGATSNFTVSSLLSATNDDRVAGHEQPLNLSQQLTSAAQAKAANMVAQNYWSHTSPSGQTPWDLIVAAGYNYQEAGENLAYGFNSATAVVAGWMSSSEHRANILNTNYKDVGFGVASSPDFQGKGPAVLVVAEYAEPAQTPAPSFSVNNSGTVEGAQSELSSQPVSRIQLLGGGQASWSLAAVSALAGGALAVLLVRHGLRLKRWLKRSERFMSHHPWLDIAFTFLFMAGYVLTRTGGLIR